MFVTRLRSIAARLAPYAPALLASGAMAALCIRGILQQAGEPAAPLDDTFIHLQYARRLAEGHFFSYVPGEGYSSGATSVLWPVLLAPFHLMGLRGVSLLWATWILGTIAHAALAVETFRVTKRLAGEAAAMGAAAMCVLFGAFAWFAWSGMETIPLAWILMRAARVAGAWCEPGSRDARSTRGEAHLVALGLAAPLIRPEGAIASLICALALAAFPLRDSRARRLPALAPLAGPLLVPMMHLAFAGHASSSTASVKWMVQNPHYGAGTILAATLSNARFLITNLMDGGEWTAVFLPEHSSIPILLGALALPICAFRRRASYHAAFVAMVALGALIPCSYMSFLWNRLRYIWPFAGAWFVLVACFARELGDLLRLWKPRLGFVTPLLMGAFAALLSTKLSWTLRDLAQSASAIAHQQVALGRWAAANLPADARIGVNDTGAIAYLGQRRTFDVVGLTTEGEARYWVDGAGSRYEHYEKLPRERLPTHFIVYPHWMACPPVLGKELTSATVTEQSILGGATMVAYEARWDTLGSGALPIAPPPGATLADEIDVADIESEKDHRYELLGAADADNQALLVGEEIDWEEKIAKRGVSDGGRMRRTIDRFEARLPAGQKPKLVMRVAANQAVTLVVSAGGKEAGRVDVMSPPNGWAELAVDLPATGAVTPIEVRVAGREGEAPSTFHSFHYWVYATP